MDILEAFCLEMNIHIGNLPDLEEFAKIKIDRDTSEFHVIDGEESDYGLIHYSCKGIKLATEIVHGGDREEWEFAHFGILLCGDVVRKIIDERLLAIVKFPTE